MTERHQITVSVNSTYIEEKSAPEHNRYLFAYTVSIHNTGMIAARLLNRHWVITDANNRVQEVRGEGVVGEKPYLRPAQTFTYTSSALLETPLGTMHGTYQLLADDGVVFDAPIPLFTLSVPRLLH